MKKTVLYNNFNLEGNILHVCRISLLVNIILIITTLSLVSLLYILMPLKEVKPYLLTVNSKYEQIVNLEPLETTKKAYDVLMESLARDYVLLRETIDFQTENKRWQEVCWLSSDELCQAFEDVMKKDNKGSPLNKFNERGIYRVVNIIASQNLGPLAPNVWQVEWEALDMDNNTHATVNKGIFISSVMAETREQKIQVNDLFKNPTGFTAISYKVATKRQINQDSNKEHGDK